MSSTCSPFVSAIVTENPDEPVDPKPDASESSAPNPPEGAAPESPPNPDAVAEVPPEDEGLPEWEPLTPELVEDEAIRGDFVIRWAVVGLALLLGFSQIADTRTLVHLKSGEYLLQHGLLPAANDVLSHSAAGKRWVNLSWMFDIVAAGVHAISGGVGLSLVQGVLTGLAFGLLAHTVRPNIRTWWGSICAILALLTCYLQYTMQPELITVLGLSFTLWTLVQAEEPGQSRRLWSLVPVIWLWAQSDPRAWLGLFLLLLWTAGDLLSPDSAPDGERSLLTKVTLASFLIVLAHPFLWESWLAPVRLYFNDYPAMRTAFAVPKPAVPSPADVGVFPLWSEYPWSPLNHRTIAALFLFASTLVTLGLNIKHVRTAHVLSFIGFNVLSVFATHELAAASIVNCVICTLNAQAWYHRQFGQIYSIDWRELLFSRGGRAVTVMSFFALAWLILSGRLDGPGGKRTGLGFENQMSIAMQDYQSLAVELLDDHPFNFSIPQGDLMIWGGIKPFIDSRIGLYNSFSSGLVLKTHQDVRFALRGNFGEAKEQDTQETKEQKAQDARKLWQEVFKAYSIHQACPRLNGPLPPPDYNSLNSLLGSNEFTLTHLTSSTAVFVRNDPTDEKTVAFLQEHKFDPAKLAFQAEPSPDEGSAREYAKPASTYDNLFSLRRPSVPAGIQVGRHYFHSALQLASTSADGVISPTSMAMVILAIRQTNQGLRDDPNCADGYRLLGSIYGVLGQMETQFASKAGPVPPIRFRYLQCVAALQQALALLPDDMEVIQRLLQQYEQMGRDDIKLQLFLRLRQLLVESRSEATLSDAQAQQRERLFEMIARLQESVTQVQTRINDALGQGVDRLQVANAAYQARSLLAAIKILEEDQVYLARNSLAKLTLGGWMLEAGRVRDASELLDSLEAAAADPMLVAWRGTTAVSALTMSNYRRAIGLLSELEKSTSESGTAPALMTLPFISLNPMTRGDEFGFPVANIGATAKLLQNARRDNILLDYQIAVAQMEMGLANEAAKSMRKALDASPNTNFRPVFRFYLDCLTGEKIEVKVDEPAVLEATDLADATESPVGDSQKTETKTESVPQQAAEPKPDEPKPAEPKPDEAAQPKQE